MKVNAERRSKPDRHKGSLPDHSVLLAQHKHLHSPKMAGNKEGSGGMPGFPGANGSGAPFDFSALQGILNVRVTRPISTFRD